MNLECCKAIDMAVNSVVKLTYTEGKIIRAREINKGLHVCINQFIGLTKTLLQ